MLQECLPAFSSALAEILENPFSVDKIPSFVEVLPETQSHTLLQQVLGHRMSRTLETGTGTGPFTVSL